MNVLWHTPYGERTAIYAATVPVLPLPTAEQEPVTVAEVEGQLNGATYDEIPRWIRTARALVESRTRIALAPQTWDLYLDAVGTVPGWIDLPRRPVIAIDSVAVISTSGETLVDPSWYWNDLVRQPGRIVFTQSISLADARESAPLRIRYTAGFADKDLIPPALIQAVLLYVADFAMHRGDEREDATKRSEPLGVSDLLREFIMPGVA